MKYKNICEDKNICKAKRIDTKEWVEGNLIYDGVSEKAYIHVTNNSVNESDKVGEEGLLQFVAYEIIPKTICRYSGLKTKNGTKIYENDIVEFLGHIGSIIYAYGGFIIGFDDPINWNKIKEKTKEINETNMDACLCDNVISLWEILWNLGDGETDYIYFVEVIGNEFDDFGELKDGNRYID